MLPRHILRRYVEPGGVRLSRVEPSDEVAGSCVICLRPVHRKRVLSVTQLDGMYKDGGFYHYGCAIEARQSKGLGKVQPAWGNLDPEDYRFWIGVRDPHLNYAMCRCCGESTYSAKERAQHFKSDKFRVNGMNCGARLALAYNLMLSTQGDCIICHKQRFMFQKWGVPICQDASCHNAWRFDHNKYVRLHGHLMAQKKKEEFLKAQTKLPPKAEDLPKDIQMVSQVGPDGATVFRPFCRVCLMMADRPEHEKEHAKRLLGGGEDNPVQFN